MSEEKFKIGSLCSKMVHNFYYGQEHLGSVWNLESTREVKNIKENYFFIFGFTVKT